MHLHHAGLTTTNLQQKKKTPTAKELKARQEHLAWLTKMGVHPQDVSNRTKGKKPNTLSVTKITDTTPACSNNFAPGGAKISIFDGEWQKIYHDEEMQRRELAAVKKAHLRKSQLAPLYNKGPIQVITPGHDLKAGNGRGKN